MGKSGKFVLDKDKKPVLLDVSKLKIKWESEGFVITDEMGVKYY